MTDRPVLSIVYVHFREDKKVRMASSVASSPKGRNKKKIKKKWDFVP